MGEGLGVAPEPAGVEPALSHRWTALGPSGSRTAPALAPAVGACSWPGGSAATLPLPTVENTARE